MANTVTEGDMVRRNGSSQIGRVLCDTSDAADGNPRVIVEWCSGEEAKISIANLTKVIQVFFQRTCETTFL